MSTPSLLSPETPAPNADAPHPAATPEPSRTPPPSSKKFELTEDRIPEKYRTAEDPLGEFLKGFDNLNGLVGKKDDELRTQLKSELEADLFKERPEAADKYVLPKIEGVDEKALGENDLVAWWRETAFAKGFGQKGFEEGVSKYIEAVRSTVPDAKAEVAKLGENAKPRLEAVSLWVNKSFQGEQLEAAREVASTARGVQLLETLMRSQTGDTGKGGETSSVSGDDEATIQKLMSSPEYYHPSKRDPKVIARVDAYFRKANG